MTKPKKLSIQKDSASSLVSDENLSKRFFLPLGRPVHLALVSSIGVFVGSLVLLMILFAFLGIAPFGGYSLAWGDAENQYLDFFAYYQDVLRGTNSINYTLSSYLGGNTFGLFAYYLASPFSLLVTLFPKEQIPVFFDIVVAIKLALCSATMNYFLAKRFVVGQDKILFCALLALSYGFSQWMFSQASNILWLDAAYLLPLIMLGVYKGVWQEKWILFSGVVAFNIICNWYMGAICGLFTIFYFVFELSLFWRTGIAASSTPGKTFLKLLGNYVLWGVLAVALSAVVLLPAITSMLGSSRSSLDWLLLSNLTFMRPLPSLIADYTPGGVSSATTCSLYAGMLVLIGVIGSFCNPRYILQKITALIFIGLLVCWNPLVGLFSLLKPAYSFYVRYAFLAIAALTFLAAMSLLDVPKKTPKPPLGKILLVYCAFAGMQVLLVNFYSEWTKEFSYVGIIVGFLIVAALYLATYKRWKKVGSFLLCLCVVMDLSYNGYLLMSNYRVEDVRIYEAHTAARMQSLSELGEMNYQTFRMNILANRLDEVNYAHQNESLAFGYASVSGYSSIASEEQVSLLSHLGYPVYKYCAVPVRYELLATDSLLGVKYIAADMPISGLDVDDVVLTEENREGDGNECLVNFYKNPYAFPLAFTTTDLETRQDPVYNNNPFIYTNDLCKYLLGSDIELYEALDYEASEVTLDGVINATYQVSVEDADDYINYGNILWKTNAQGQLVIEDKDPISYGGVWDPTVFEIPQNESLLANITYSTKEGNIVAPQFYALNLNALQRLSQLANDKSVAIEDSANSRITMTCDADINDSLIISIPYDKHWNATVNNKPTNIEITAGCLMVVPLDDGSNTIVMEYVVDSWIPGLVMSLSAIAIMIILVWLQRFYQKRQQEK